MSEKANCAAVIQPAPRLLREACFLLLFSDPPETGRWERIAEAVRLTAREEKQRAGLLAALRQEKLVGAIWAQHLPGRVAIVLPPRTVPGEASRTANDLLDELDSVLVHHGIQVAQAVLAPDARQDAELFERCGYRRAAELLYLFSDQAQFPAKLPKAAVDFEPYQPSQRARMARMIQTTYQQSLDVPCLDGMRSIQDVLTGYENTGDRAGARWFFVTVDSRDVGCLLLADHPHDGQWELVYMGVVPQSRGSSVGRHMVRFAQWLTGQAGRQRIVLGVDAANDPAISIYTAAGFAACGRRTVFLKGSQTA